MQKNKLLFIFLLVPIVCRANIDSLNYELLSAKGPERVQIMLTISKLYLKSDSLSSAEYLAHAEAEANELKIDTVSGNVRLHKGYLFQMRNRIDSSAYYYKAALDKYTEAGNEELIAKAYYQLGNLYSHNDRYEEAMKMLNKGLNIKNNSRFLQKIHQEIGVTYGLTGRYMDALRHYDIAHELKMQRSDSSDIIYYLVNSAIAYSNLGIYDLAISRYEDALVILEQETDSLQMAATLTNIANIYHMWGKRKAALSRIRDALAIVRAMNNEYGLGIVYTNMATFYAEGGNIDSAEKYYNKSQKIFNSLNITPMLIAVYQGIGDLFSSQKMYDSAMVYLNKGRDLLNIVKVNDYILSLNKSLANVYIETGQYENAEKALNEIIDLAMNNKMNNDLMDIYKLRAELYSKTEQCKKAYIAMKNYSELSDSLFSDKMDLKVSSINSYHDNITKKIENRMLEAENSRRQVIIWGLSLLITAFAMFLIFYYRKSVKLRRANSTLSERNIKIQEVNTELGHKNKMISDQNAELAVLFDQLSERERNLKSNIMAKDKFFSVLAHDMSNPLQGILMTHSVLGTALQKQKYDFALKHHNNMGPAINKLQELIQDLLDWYRAQSGNMEAEMKMIALDYLIEKVMDSQEASATNKSITLKYKRSGFQALADSMMLTVILRNLISNAIKFSYPDCSIDIYCTDHTDKTQISVSDTGVGIEGTRIKTLFQIGANESTTGTGNEKGTGLGLALCYEYAQQMGGKLSVESIVGLGTEFIIELPKPE